MKKQGAETTASYFFENSAKNAKNLEKSSFFTILQV
jgi:hypothetical protein